MAISAVVEAVFRTRGFQSAVREFESFSAKMKRMGSDMRSWGGGPKEQENFARRFIVSRELEQSEEKLKRVGRAYDFIKLRMDQTTDPGRRATQQRMLDSLVRMGERELHIQKDLTLEGTKQEQGMLRAAMIRRGLRLGLGVLGLPMTLGAAARGAQEASEQEKLTLGMAARMRGPITDFTEHTINMRKQIVDAGAEFAFTGREALQLADNLSQIAGRMIDMRGAFAAARGLGIAPQVAGQFAAYSARFGGREAGNDEKLMRVIGQGIAHSGMSPRSAEFVQSVVQAMQTYSSRLPSVSAGNLMAILSALSSETQPGGGAGVGRLAPTLRGQGGMQVIQGLTSMMDDMSEAMVAVQTELVGQDPKAFAGMANRLGVNVDRPGGITGSERYALTMALKQSGIADNDGLRLAGRTIKTLTSGLDDATRLSIESHLLRLSIPITSALEKGGFIRRLKEGDISQKEFARAVDDFKTTTGSVMETPAMQWGRMGTELRATMTEFFERRFLGPTGKPVGAVATLLQEGRENGTLGRSLLEAPFMAAAVGLHGLGSPGMRRMGMDPDKYPRLAALYGIAGSFDNPLMRGVERAEGAVAKNVVELFVHIVGQGQNVKSAQDARQIGETVGDAVHKWFLDSMENFGKAQTPSGGINKLMYGSKI